MTTKNKIKIVLYGKIGDAYTSAFKNFLKTSDVDFTFVDIFKNLDAKKHTQELYQGNLKFPTLFVDNQVYLTPTSDEFNKLMKELNLRG